METAVPKRALKKQSNQLRVYDAASRKRPLPEAAEAADDEDGYVSCSSKLQCKDSCGYAVILACHLRIQPGQATADARRHYRSRRCCGDSLSVLEAKEACVSTK